MTLEVTELTTQALRDEVAGFELGDSHGLVGFSPDGTLSAKIPGHRFGKPEIRAKLDSLLE